MAGPASSGVACAQAKTAGVENRTTGYGATEPVPPSPTGPPAGDGNLVIYRHGLSILRISNLCRSDSRFFSHLWSILVRENTLLRVMYRAFFSAASRVFHRSVPVENGLIVFPSALPLRRRCMSTAAESSGSGGRPAAKSPPSSSRSVKFTSESCVFFLIVRISLKRVVLLRL